MKFLICDTYYQGFLDSFYKKNHSRNLKYDGHLKWLLSGFFGTADSYSHYLRKLGHSSTDVILNDEMLQRKWARENGVEVAGSGFISKLQSFPYINRFIGKPKWLQQIALEQIKKYRPDILYMQNLSILNPETLVEAKKYCKLLVGQIAYLLPPNKYLEKFDLILTSFPHYVQKLRKIGVGSEYLKIGFDPRVLQKVGAQNKRYELTFVGSYTPQHMDRARLLEEIAKYVPINIWGRGMEFLSPISPLRKNFHGDVYGLGMYKILAQSKIVVNHHISASDGYANNMRLYESTGMGAMLITDRKKNLGNLFKVGKEVVDYKDSKNLIEKIGYYLKNEAERKRIAEAGQRRTLKDHTYLNRMRDLIKILEKHV